jgi:hypothetical protein
MEHMMRWDLGIEYWQLNVDDAREFTTTPAVLSCKNFRYLA